jgi:hypothetical protein
MTPAEEVAMHELEAAEQAVRAAVRALEDARAHLDIVTRRERRHERTKTRARAHLRIVRARSSR